MPPKTWTALPHLRPKLPAKRATLPAKALGAPSKPETSEAQGGLHPRCNGARCKFSFTFYISNKYNDIVVGLVLYTFVHVDNTYQC